MIQCAKGKWRLHVVAPCSPRRLLGLIANQAGGTCYGAQLCELIVMLLGMGTRVIGKADIVLHGLPAMNGKDAYTCRGHT